jgi:DNA invertase Pin-like site-specific DNA recombinase
MAIIAYCRVSTNDQDTTTQHERLSVVADKVFTEKQSATSTKGRTALAECLEYMREGDTLLVTKIDRLARSSRDLHNIVHDLEERGIGFKVLDQAIDTSTPHGKAFLGMLATFAEFETNIRKERQAEGIAAAKAKGKYMGRKPKAQDKTAQVMELVEQGLTKQAVADRLEISVSSVYGILKKQKEQVASA